MKLEKISLRNMSDVLTDNEMKSTRGGYSDGGGYSAGFYCMYTNYGQITQTECFLSLNSSIALCSFWAAAGESCRCYSC